MRGRASNATHAGTRGNTRGTRPADGCVERLEAAKAAGAHIDKPATLANAKEWVPTHLHAGTRRNTREHAGTRGAHAGNTTVTHRGV